MFDLQKFCELSGRPLIDYAVQVLDAPHPPQARQLADLLNSMNSYDDEHVLFALEIGAKYWPDAFVPLAPGMLVHKSQAVRVSALRVLRRAPVALVSQSLLVDVEANLAFCPEKDSFKEILSVLAQRLPDN